MLFVNVMVGSAARRPSSKQSKQMVLCSEPAALENNDELKQTMMAATNDVYDSSIQRIIRSDKGEWTMHTPLKNQ